MKECNLFALFLFPSLIKCISILLSLVFLFLKQNHHHHRRGGQGLNGLGGNNGPFCCDSPPFLFCQLTPSVDHTPPRIRLDRIRRFPSLKSFHVLVVFWLKYCPLTVVCIIDGGHDRGVGSPEGGAWEYSPSSITLSHYHIITSSALSKYHNIDQNTPKMWNNSSCNIHTEFLCEKYHTIWPVSKIPQTIITPKSRKPKFSLSQLKVL